MSALGEAAELVGHLAVGGRGVGQQAQDGGVRRARGWTPRVRAGARKGSSARLGLSVRVLLHAEVLAAEQQADVGDDPRNDHALLVVEFGDGVPVAALEAPHSPLRCIVAHRP